MKAVSRTEQEKYRRFKLEMQAKSLRGTSPSNGLRIMADMNSAVLRICAEKVKSGNPGIGERELVRRVKRIYWEDIRQYNEILKEVGLK